MNISEKILLFIAKKWKSAWDKGHPDIKESSTSEEHNMQYAYFQLFSKIKYGIKVNVYSKRVLEIGCGHGGISVYAALNGAKQVVGIDLSDEALSTANKFKNLIFKEIKYKPNILFSKMTAENLVFENESIDVVIADNVFEHVTDIDVVMKECNRVLSKGGKVVVPNFPSFHSKFGSHVKYGIKIPWVHVLFKERTVINVMHVLAKNDNKMYEFYPGLKKGAKTYQEIRSYNDLNYISNKKFTNSARSSGFSIESMVVNRPNWAWLLIKMLPFLRKTKLDDIFSNGTSAILVKN
jgi:ubiquinone/menaquinone biosynthesis C-methylase UbiE